MIGFKIDFLLILDGFWAGLGGQVGPKIHQKSIKNRYGKVVEFLIEKWGVRCTQVYAGNLGWGPLNQSTNQPRTVRGQHLGPRHSPRAQGPVADISKRTTENLQKYFLSFW